MDDQMNKNELLSNEDFEERPSEVMSENDLDIAQVMNSIDNICTSVALVSTSLSDAVVAVSNVRAQIAELDHKLDMFIVESETRLAKFRTATPIIEKQLENASGRIDKITDKILESFDGDVTNDSLQKQSLLIDLLQETNNSFNNMLVRLISI